MKLLLMRKLKLEELNRLSTDAFQKTNKLPIIVILDNIRSALNVGSVFRSADAFKIEKIFLCGCTAIPPHRDILKSALGATETVRWQYFEKVEDALDFVLSANYLIYTVEQTDNSIFLQDVIVEKNQKLAFVFGNEVDGVSDVAFSYAKANIEVPQWGTKHSLNVSVCSGIVLWEIAKKMIANENI
jgi:23S rRNA (guanosine2251-2'-O)-methyltransferase